MQYFTLLLALVAFATAIDVRLYQTGFPGHCSGSAFQCTNLGPDQCCGQTSQKSGAIGFHAIPYGWRINVKAYLTSSASPYGCGKIAREDWNRLQRDWCVQVYEHQPLYQGGAYTFQSRKRDVNGLSAECVAPDAFVLEDGRKFDITGMEPSVLEELVAHGANGTAAVDVPEGYMRFEKRE